jgi:CRISPR system Cascade subunit CasE
VLQSVLYEGHLKIADLEAFQQTLAAGLGHAKALGFGLLSIGKG